MNWDKLLKFASYYGLRFRFDYNKEDIRITLEYRDGPTSYTRTRSFPRDVFDKFGELEKSVIIHDMMTNLAKYFELEGKDAGLI